MKEGDLMKYIASLQDCVLKAEHLLFTGTGCILSVFVSKTTSFHIYGCFVHAFPISGGVR